MVSGAAHSAAALNVAPGYQVFYPDGKSRRPAALRHISRTIQLDKTNVQIVALKKAESGNALIVRLQEVAGRP